jgi:hypothetical protein
MGTCPRPIEARSLQAEPELTDAAMGAYGRLLAIFGARLQTHPTRDGGMICEDRRTRTRPAMWRISPDGAILPDSRYSFALGGFTPVAVPQGV